MARKSTASSTRQTRTTVTARKPSSRPRKKAPAPIEVDQDRIAARAYEIYCERSRTGQPGSPEGDWATAEAELKAGPAK